MIFLFNTGTRIPYANLLRLESIKIDVVLNDKSKHELKQHNTSWTVDIEKQFHKTMFSLNIEAVRADGKPISMTFNKVLGEKDEAHKLKLHVKKEVLHTKGKDRNIEGENKHKGKVENKKKTSEHEKEDKKKEPDVNWTVIISSIVVGNILLIVIFGGGYIYMKRRKEKLAKSLADEINRDDEEKVKEEKPGEDKSKEESSDE